MGADQTQGPSNPESQNPQDQPPKAPPRRRKRRWWLRILVLFIALIVVLIALAPTILSTGMMRNWIVGKINRGLTGKLEIAHWSLGWRSGVAIDNLCVKEADGSTCLQAKRIASKLSLFKAIRGKFDFGQTTVDDLEFTFRQYADGTNNFSRLSKGPSKPLEKLPDLSIDLTANARGSVIVEGKPPIQVTALTIKAATTDINLPVDHRIEIACRTADGGEGKVIIAGKLGIIGNNEIRMGALKVDEAIEIKDLALDAVQPFIAAEGLKKLDGKLSGSLTLAMADGRSGAVEGEFKTGKLAATVLVPTPEGEKPVTETYSTDQLVFRIPKTTITMPDGPGKWQTGRIQVGAGQSLPILIQVDQGQVTATVDTAIGALMNALANKKPGGDGVIALQLNFNLKKLADQMPRTFGLHPGVKLTGGTIDQSTRLTMTNAKAEYSQTATIKDIKGQNAKGNIELKDITIALGATSLGGGGMIPELQDIRANLKSEFANIDIQGPTLSALKGTGSGDLALMRQQLGQFRDLGKAEFGGTFTLKLDSTGDLAVENGSSKLTVNIDVENASLKNVGSLKPIAEPKVNLVLNATLRRGKDVFIGGIEDYSARLLAGPDHASPIIDAKLTGKVDPKASTVNANVAIDLERAQQAYPALMAGFVEKKIVVQKGAVLTLVANGSVGKGLSGGDGAISAKGDLKFADVTLKQDGKSLISQQTIPVKFDIARDASDTVTINQFQPELDGGKTLKLDITGRITHATSRPAFDVKIAMDYDAPKLLPFLQPFVTADLSTYKVSGSAANQVFTITGSYPTDLPFAQAIKDLKMTGGLSLASLETMGLKLEKINPTMQLADGVFTVNAQPIACNGGTLDIDGARLSLTSDSPELTLRKGSALVKSVGINHTLASEILGRGSFLFHNIREASGPLDVTIVECNNLPLAWLALGDGKTKSPVKAGHAGRAELTLNLVAARLGSGLLFDVLKAVGGKFGTASSEVSINNAKVTIADGQITSDIPLLLERQKLGVTATVRSFDSEIVRGEFSIPKTLTNLPTDVKVPVKGKITAPVPDLAGVLKQSLTPDGIGNIIKDATGKDGKKDPKPPIKIPGL